MPIRWVAVRVVTGAGVLQSVMGCRWPLSVPFSSGSRSCCSSSPERGLIVRAARLSRQNRGASPPSRSTVLLAMESRVGLMEMMRCGARLAMCCDGLRSPLLCSWILSAAFALELVG